MDKKKNTYKSHVVLIRLLTKTYQYRIKNDTKLANGLYIDYLDICDNKIKTEKAKELDAEEKYFDPFMEDFLAKGIENEFGLIVDNLTKELKMNYPSNKVEILTNEQNIVRKFFQYSFARTKSFYNQVKEQSVIASRISGFSPSTVISFIDSINNFFDNRKIYIIYNVSNLGFVCPHGVISYIYMGNEKEYGLFINVSKQLSFIMCTEKVDDNADIIIFNTDDKVKMFNYAVYISEKNHCNPYIVGLKSDLFLLQNSILEFNGKDEFLMFRLKSN